MFYGLKRTITTGSYGPRVCKNVFECDRYSTLDWKSRFYAKSTSADVPINFRFNVDAHTSILGEAFLHTLGQKQPLWSSLHIAPISKVPII
ncbi:hypothetical protein A1D17_25600 [Pseudomonas fluorescens]|uniref:Uncharacterized protein n=1 Tax=Pseudomonas fluorescens TaxID=294 RepID=A0A166PVG5_PSEFL|nr:hypothetical protein A1D17_25600 [Pseudomonas fluorescens]